jgi:hypothetical protein
MMSVAAVSLNKISILLSCQRGCLELTMNNKRAGMLVCMAIADFTPGLRSLISLFTGW